MAYPAEFRRDVVAVAREKQASMVQIAKDFGISDSCLQRWVRQADIDEGYRGGVSTTEAAEMTRATQAQPPAGDGERGPPPCGDLPRPVADPK